MKRVYVSVSQSHDGAYLSFVNDVLKLLVEAGVDPVLSPEGSEYWHRSGFSHIQAMEGCDVVVGLVDSDTASVFFDLGYAVANRVPVMIFCASAEKVPDFLRDTAVTIKRSSSSIVDELRHLTESLKKYDFPRRPSLSRWYNDCLLYQPDLFCELDRWRERGQRSPGIALEEQLTAWFVSQGYNVERGSASRDAGYDLLVHGYKGQDATLVTLKSYAAGGKVSVGQVQQLADAIRSSGADGGVFITNGDYTASARDFAKTVGYQIDLLTMRDVLEEHSKSPATQAG